MVQDNQSDAWSAVDKAKRYTVPLTNAMADSMAAKDPERTMLRQSVNMMAMDQNQNVTNP